MSVKTGLVVEWIGLFVIVIGVQQGIGTPWAICLFGLFVSIEGYGMQKKGCGSE